MMILASIDDIPDALNRAYGTLRDALEVVGVKHQEHGTQPIASELADLTAMTSRLRDEVEAEVAIRGG